MTRPQTQYDIQSVISVFETTGFFKSGHRYGNGHINDTFYVETDDGKYILQRVNQHVFHEPVRLMENVLRVTRHVRTKMEERGKDADRHSLNLVKAEEGNHWHIDADGNVWRLYLYVDNTVGYDIVETADQAAEGGRAFGEFQSMLVDLPGERLHDTIPDFHNMEKRLSTFFNAVAADCATRCAAASREIRFVETRAHDMCLFVRLGRDGKLTERTTHNDTKFNNVLLDKDSDLAVCVIDLDTVMPGYVLYDFGDSIRTATNTGSEDDLNLDRVGINLDLFEGYTKGYLAEARSFLTEEEKAQLAYSARVMTFIIGLRFLSDYIDGDHYFRVHRPHHNLERARAQFKLLETMERDYSQMVDIVGSQYDDGGPA